MKSVIARINKHTPMLRSRSSIVWLPFVAVGALGDVQDAVSLTAAFFTSVYFPYCRWAEALAAAIY